MKSIEKPNGSITEPLLRELVDRQKRNDQFQNPTVGSKPLPAPSLYQDAGAGYNSNFMFPQD